MKKILILCFLLIHLFSISQIVNNDTTLCMGDTLHLFSENALSYKWYPSSGLDNDTSQNPILITDSLNYSIDYYLETIKLSNNLVNNGDFEKGNTGFTTTYTYCNSNNCLFPLIDYGYSIGNNATFYHTSFIGKDHTSGSGNFMIINGANPSLIVWKEIINVKQNTNYKFGTWISTMVNLTPSEIRFSINGIQLGSIFKAPDVVDEWTEVFTEWYSGSEISATIEIVDVLPVSYGNDFGLDDIFFGEIQTITDNVHLDIVSCDSNSNNESNFINIPNAFTPNGDGFNDVFRPLPSDKIKWLSMYIYNKWGQLLFKTSDVLKGWSGNDYSDVYIWVLQYKDETDEIKSLRGNVYLLK